MERLRQRADFLATAAGTKVPSAGFVLQARSGEAGPIRVGFTVSRKVGTATERNRVRRRLKEMVRLTSEERMRPHHDYVLVGRRAALDLSFERLQRDFEGALKRLHGGRGKPGRSDAGGGGKAGSGSLR